MGFYYFGQDKYIDDQEAVKVEDQGAAPSEDTLSILDTDDTHKVIPRLNIQSALNPEMRNLRLNPLDGETVGEYVKSVSEEQF